MVRTKLSIYSIDQWGSTIDQWRALVVGSEIKFAQLGHVIYRLPITAECVD